MATSYLELTNQVLEDLRYNPTSQTDFASPAKEEVRLVKRLLNEAKDEILPRVGLDLMERKFVIETSHPYRKIAYPTVLLTVNRTVINTDSAVFLSDVVGWKAYCPGILYDDPNIEISGSGLSDSTPHTVNQHVNSQQIRVTHEWMDTNQVNVPTDWAVYQDEFDLDASVRQVLWASTSEGPLELIFVERADIANLRNKAVEFGTPTYAYVFRSETEGRIWRMQLHPIPSQRVLVSVAAVIRLADLVAYDDAWDLEPEIERMVKDRAVYRALATPIKNDLEMAAMRRADLKERVMDWKDAYAPQAPNRIARRRGPDEALPRGVNVRFNIENP